ncbi:MAG TPA: hypothetical protein VEL47_00040 [Myxococcota bacterium]|nr:hypothetical protein [Myxococcota bacterium]
MTRLNAIFVLILAFSSVCFGATLMQRTMAKSANDLKSKGEVAKTNNLKQSCNALIMEQEKGTVAKVAKELYQRAYSLSFNGDWQEAEAASKCAAHILNGTDHWAIEAETLLGSLHER